MGLLEFLKRVGSRDTRQRGERRARPMERRPNEPTQSLRRSAGELPPPLPQPPRPVYTPPASGAHGPEPQRTVVRPTPRPPAPAPPPPRSVETVIVNIDALHSGRVVGVLVAIDGPLEGEVYRLVDGENKLGRDEKCEVQLENERISREHACIVHASGTFAIKALSDKNPTFVNDAQVDGIELGDGDTLKLGRTTLRFRSV